MSLNGGKFPPNYPKFLLPMQSFHGNLTVRMTCWVQTRNVTCQCSTIFFYLEFPEGEP